MVILVIHVTDGGASVGDCGRYGKGDVDCGYGYV